MGSWPNSLPDYRWPDDLSEMHSPIKQRLLAVAFHAAQLIGRILSLFDRRRERVLVIRTDGAGDGLLFEPALRSLANTVGEIHLWAPALTCELLSRSPSIQGRMIIPRGFRDGNLEYFGSLSWRMQLGFALGRRQFAKAIYPAQSPEPLGNWLVASVRADERWICEGDTINQFESQRQSAHARATRIVKRPSGAVHELSANASLAREWNDPSPPGLPKVHLNQELLARADAQIEAWKVEMNRLGGQEIIGVVPAGSMSLNHYPPDRWVEVISKLWKQRRAVPVLLGGPDDQRIADHLANELRASGVPCLRLFMPSGILDMAALISRLDGVLSVDTGLAHLAIAQHVPTVVLVGGGNPGRFFPWPDAPHHDALNVATACAGCNNRCTESEAICITTISPDEIVNAYARVKSRPISLQIYVDTPTALPMAG